MRWSDALNAGRIRAALDVTDPEPLPAGHPLWSCPNLLLTPHVGGSSPQFAVRALRIAAEELAATSPASRSRMWFRPLFERLPHAANRAAQHSQ
jgi:phosphoglycerate dehydrogenase-like enzyme